MSELFSLDIFDGYFGVAFFGFLAIVFWSFPAFAHRFGNAQIMRLAKFPIILMLFGIASLYYSLVLYVRNKNGSVELGTTLGYEAFGPIYDVLGLLVTAATGLFFWRKRKEFRAGSGLRKYVPKVFLISMTLGAIGQGGRLLLRESGTFYLSSPSGTSNVGFHLPSNAKIHRKNVEEFQDGFALAKSTHGRFSVKLGLPFTDFSVMNPKDSNVMIEESIVASSTDGFVFLATRAARNKNRSVDAIISKVRENPAFSDVTTSTQGKFRILSVKESREKDYVLGQFVFFDDDFITLQVRFPKQKQDLGDLAAAHFFNSLVVED